MEDTPNGETGTPKAPENNAGTTNSSSNQTTTTAIVDTSEVEKLRKEKEQAEMRANQLQNQLKSKEEAEAQLKAKELEEQNKFKELFEQEKAKREALESEKEAEETRKALDDAKKTVFANYSDEVKTLAEEAGMTLADTDDSSIQAFKEKLDKVAKLVSATGKVGPNNPGNRNTNNVELSPDELKVALKDSKIFEEIVSKRPGLALMMNRRNIAQ